LGELGFPVGRKRIMRGLLVFVIVVGSLPVILVRPSWGIVMWCWISYMNPHRLAYGFAHDFPFAQVIAIATFLGILPSRESKQAPPLTFLSALWLLFYLWTGVTTIFAIYPEHAWEKFITFSKVQVMTVATVMIMCDRRRLNWLVWIIVLSIGFFGVKGGIFTLLRGGANRVWGPPNSIIEDNNALALALFMLLPLAYYLRSQTRHSLVRHGLLVAMVLMVAAAVGSYSRGGFLAGISMAFVLWIKSRNKILTGLVVAAIIPFFLFFMPKGWHDRMNTIETYQQDHSAMNRIEAWKMAYNTANRRPLGGGFDYWSPESYAAYGPKDTFKNPGTRGAHSIYFSVLGEHGWVGLALFMSVFIGAWRTGSWIIRMTRDVEHLAWLGQLARMIQVSFIAYATGGAFQSLAYFDFPWHLVSMLVIGRTIVERHLAESAAESVDLAVPQRFVLNGSRTTGAHT
jgi:probable O-glycosylation ligase (exosortase A-associated)